MRIMRIIKFFRKPIIALKIDLLNPLSRLRERVRVRASFSLTNSPHQKSKEHKVPKISCLPPQAGVGIPVCLAITSFLILLTSNISLAADEAAPQATQSDYTQSDVLEEISEEEDLSIFRNAVILSGVDKEITEGDFTVFGPENDAFKKMDPALLKKLEAVENRDKLKRFVRNHIVKGTVYLVNSNDKTTRMETISPGDVIMAKKLGNKGSFSFTVNGRSLLSKDMHSDGILYKLDGFAVDIDQWEFKEPGAEQPQTNYSLH